MQKICSKCGSETNYDGDIHCRNVFLDEIGKLLSVQEWKKAKDFYFSAPFDNAWKERALDKQSSEFWELIIDEEKKVSEFNHLLKNNEMFKLANFYYQLFVNFPGGDDGWNLAKACKFFRMAGMPEKAIEITNGFPEKIIDHAADAAIYTSRGAAFRRLSNHAEAKRCANKAISLSPESFYPYNLLGGISYDEGNPEEGDKYFAKASELGSPPRMQEAEIRSALQHTETEAKNYIIAYLLRKDPQKYAWVKEFQTN